VIKNKIKIMLRLNNLKFILKKLKFRYCRLIFIKYLMQLIAYLRDMDFKKTKESVFSEYLFKTKKIGKNNFYSF
jgi:hypothetical protein